MVKFGSLVGALFGAGGCAAYYNGATEQGTLLNYLLGSPHFGNFSRSAPGQAGSNPDFESLSQAVERLAREVRQGGQSHGVTVIHGSQGTSAIFTYGGVILVSAMGVMYIRGWKLSDFLYVTRASLQKSMATVSNSVEGLTQRMNNVRQIIGQQIESVKKRQEDAMKAQQELKSQMNVVGADVESTRSSVEDVHNDLTKLGSEVQALTDSQQDASNGIYLLCSIMGDIVHSSNRRYPELDKYLKRPRGLESLPDVNQSVSSNAVRLLPAASSPSEINTEKGTDKLDVLKPLRDRAGISGSYLPRPWSGFGGPNSKLSRQFSGSVA